MKRKGWGEKECKKKEFQCVMSIYQVPQGCPIYAPEKCTNKKYKLKKVLPVICCFPRFLHHLITCWQAKPLKHLKMRWSVTQKVLSTRSLHSSLRGKMLQRMLWIGGELTSLEIYETRHGCMYTHTSVPQAEHRTNHKTKVRYQWIQRILSPQTKWCHCLLNFHCAVCLH